MLFVIDDIPSFRIHFYKTSIADKWQSLVQESYVSDGKDIDSRRSFYHLQDKTDIRNDLLKAIEQINSFLKFNFIKLPEKIDWNDENLYNELHVYFEKLSGDFVWPKEVIKHALRDTLQKITQEYGYDAVMIPRKKSAKCTYAQVQYRGWKRLPFELLLDVMDFTLDNTLIEDFDGQLWRQKDGIPMGDPHSPGFCIGTCAWMEEEWKKNLDSRTQENFCSTRYMDDVLTIYAKNDTWDHERYLKEFTTECYFPPLRLEITSDSTFLESRLEMGSHNIRYKLKNENYAGQEPKTWRYAHFSCYSNFEQKNTVLRSCLKKVQRAASDTKALIESGKQKINEFLRLYYPKKMIWRACTTMGVTTRDPAWFRIRDILNPT